MPTTTLSIRIPSELLERVDALTEVLSRDATVAAIGRQRDGHLSRSATMALVILRGVEALEAEHKRKR